MDCFFSAALLFLKVACAFVCLYSCARCAHARGRAVQVAVEEEEEGAAPLVRVENHTPWPVHWAQNGVALARGPAAGGAGVAAGGGGVDGRRGDVLPPRASAAFGWDAPCPPAARRAATLALRLSLAPLSDPDLFADAVVGAQVSGSVS